MCVTFKCIYLQQVRQDSRLLESFSGWDQYRMPQCSLAMHVKVCFGNAKPGDNENYGNSTNLVHCSLIHFWFLISHSGTNQNYFEADLILVVVLFWTPGGIFLPFFFFFWGGGFTFKMCIITMSGVKPGFPEYKCIYRSDYSTPVLILTG